MTWQGEDVIINPKNIVGPETSSYLSQVDVGLRATVLRLTAEKLCTHSK